MDRAISVLLVVAAMVAATGPAHSAGFEILHEFAGGDGEDPNGSLTLGASTLYGMTSQGGNSNRGTIFSIGTDGSNFTLLHEFTAGVDDGGTPFGSVTLSGSTLYGMTYRGGGSDEGVVFSIDTDGSNFTLLHEFAASVDNGENPRGSLTLSGSTLYGMTGQGGDFTYGTVFSIDTNGNNFTLLHEFAGGSEDGSSPRGDLTLSGSTLYGMTAYGGGYDEGTVFSIGTVGSDFTLLHEFAAGIDDGEEPFGSLTLSGSTLYGTTRYGGDSGEGTVFSMGVDGGNFTLLREFDRDVDDGRNPFGSLTLSGSILYGMTYLGGEFDEGTVFSMDTDGSNFTLLHEFAASVDDGENPWGNLTLDGAALYGMTTWGGDSDCGVIFVIPETTTLSLLLLAGLAGLRRRR